MTKLFKNHSNNVTTEVCRCSQNPIKTNGFLMFLGHRHHLVVVLLGCFVDRLFIEFSLILGSKINEKSIKNLLTK